MDLIDDRDAIDHDESSVRMVADGHVHITNRVYWEGIDTWQPQPFGFDYARAAAGGVNVVIGTSLPTGSGSSTTRRSRPTTDRGVSPRRRAAR